MFVASKLHQPFPISAQALIAYTADSITANELLSWELLLLGRLRWDIAAPVPHHMFEPLLRALQVPEMVMERLKPYLYAYGQMVYFGKKMTILAWGRG